MTRAQEIDDGVLLRPFESLATNFLSSRYYNGRQIVDLLDTAEQAEHWMRVLRAALSGPSPFLPDKTQLDNLRVNRFQIEALYEKTVNETLDDPDVVAFDDTLGALHFSPRLRVGGTGSVDISWLRSDTADIASDLIAAVSVAAIDTITGPRSRLLRRCHAPRCVLYFTQFDSRQHWCSNVCGNRARVARASENKRRST